MPAGQERAERLPGRTGEGQVDGAVGQPLAPVALGDLVAEDRADGAVDVADLELGPHRLAALEGRLGDPDQLVVERLVEAVVLLLGAVEVLVVELAELTGAGRLVEDRRQVEPGGLPVVHRLAHVERVDPADRLVERAEAELGQQLAHLLRRCTRRT